MSQPDAPSHPPLQAKTLTDAAPAGPTREVERIAVLDALRGFALLGIFCVNIHLFALPIAWAYDPVDVDPNDQWSRLSLFLVEMLCEYKFVSLFSLLFGAGFAILLERLASRNASVKVYYRRLFVLGIFGLLHGLLFWWGDILFLYAVVGCVLTLFRRTSPKVLAIFGACAIVGSVLLFGAMSGLQLVMMDAMEQQTEAAESTEPSAIDDEPREWTELLAESQLNLMSEQWLELEFIAYAEGPYYVTFIVRAIEFLFIAIMSLTLQGFGLRVLGMFLIGMALYRSGFFRGRGGPAPILLVLIGLGPALLAESLFATFMMAPIGEFSLSWVLVEAGHQIASAFLCLGYVGLFMMIIRLAVLEPVMYGLACVGRLALTSYLMQTVIATTVMYWYGLGLYGRTDRWEQLVIVGLVFGFQVCFSIIWLRSFQMGPLEWLWRWATYGRKPSFRRRGIGPSE